MKDVGDSAVSDPYLHLGAVWAHMFPIKAFAILLSVL